MAISAKSMMPPSAHRDPGPTFRVMENTRARLQALSSKTYAVNKVVLHIRGQHHDMMNHVMSSSEWRPPQQTVVTLTAGLLAEPIQKTKDGWGFSLKNAWVTRAGSSLAPVSPPDCFFEFSGIVKTGLSWVYGWEDLRIGLPAFFEYFESEELAGLSFKRAYPAVAFQILQKIGAALPLQEPLVRAKVDTVKSHLWAGLEDRSKPSLSAECATLLSWLGLSI